MAGLLRENKPRDFLSGALTAAALGTNPLVGLLAAPGIRRGREKRERENAILRDQFAAREDLIDLMGQTSTVSQNVEAPGMMLESIDGDPMQLPGKRYIQDTEVPTYRTQEGQQQLMGIMARMNPEAAMKMALPATERTNSLQQKFDAARMEGRRRGLEGDALNEFIDSAVIRDSENPWDAMLFSFKEAEERRREAEEKRAAEAATREAEERAVKKAEYRNNLSSSAANLMELYSVNEKLSQNKDALSFLTQPGLPGSEIRRTAAAFLTPEAAAEVNNFDSLVNQIAIERLKTENFDGNTNARFAAFTATKPSYGFMGSANSKTIIRNLRGILLADQANNNTLSKEERSRIEAFIAQARADGVVDLEIGDIEDGYEYIGGPPNQATSWKKL